MIRSLFNPAYKNNFKITSMLKLREAKSQTNKNVLNGLPGVLCLGVY